MIAALEDKLEESGSTLAESQLETQELRMRFDDINSRTKSFEIREKEKDIEIAQLNEKLLVQTSEIEINLRNLTS
jgi:hypothetical protein